MKGKYGSRKLTTKVPVDIPAEIDAKVSLYMGNGKPEFSIWNANTALDSYELVVWRGKVNLSKQSKRAKK